LKHQTKHNIINIFIYLLQLNIYNKKQIN
jgi:hypothetical protein